MGKKNISGDPPKLNFIKHLLNDFSILYKSFHLSIFADDDTLYFRIRKWNNNKIVKDNNKIVISGKFHAIIFNKSRWNHTGQIINIAREKSHFRLSGIDICDNVNFSHGVNNIFKSAWNQLSALIRLKHLLILIRLGFLKVVFSGGDHSNPFRGLLIFQEKLI